MNDAPELLLEHLAARHWGVFTRADARGLGVTDGALHRRVREHRWIRMLPGVYRVGAFPRTLRQRAMAAARWSEALVSHETAGRLWSLEGILAVDVHITTDRGRGLRNPDVVVHRTSQLLPADRGVVHGIAVTSPLRTVIDLADRVDASILELAIEDALRRGLFTVGQLRWRASVRLGSGVRGAVALGALLLQQQLGITGSGWEVRTARVLTDAGLPEPRRQHPVDAARGRFRVDLAYPPSIVFEYDSDRWHSSAARRHHDAQRRNALRLAGCTVIEVTPGLLRAPDTLVALARRALGAAMSAR